MYLLKIRKKKKRMAIKTWRIHSKNQKKIMLMIIRNYNIKMSANGERVVKWSNLYSIWINYIAHWTAELARWAPKLNTLRRFRIKLRPTVPQFYYSFKPQSGSATQNRYCSGYFKSGCSRVRGRVYGGKSHW